MDDKLEEKIIQCLEALENGQSLEQVLSLFPDDKEALRPALETAAALADFRVAHSIQAQSSSRQRFLEKAEALRQGPEEKKVVLGFWQRIFYPLAFLAAFVVVLGVGTYITARSALPGDVLYGAKLTFEGIRLSLVRDLQVHEQLQQEFQEERLQEIRELLESGRQADVILQGTIDAINGNDWLVEGIPVALNDATIVDGVPTVGVRVQIEGRTTLDKLEADEVIVAAVEQPAPEPTVTPSRTAVPTAEATVEATHDYSQMLPSENETPTLTLTPTPTPSRTPSPTATATPTPTRTSTPTPPPSLTPTPPTDDNNNNSGPGGDDNDNDNDNDNTSGPGGDDNDNDNDNDNTSGPSGGEDNDNNSGPGGGNDNDNDNDNNSGPGGGNDNDNDNDNDNNSGPGGGNDNDNDNDNHSGPGGGGNDNDNDNDSGSGGGGFSGDLASSLLIIYPL